MFSHLQRLFRGVWRNKWWVLLLLAAGVGLGWGGKALRASNYARYHLRAAEQGLERLDLDRAQEHLELYLAVRPRDGAAQLLAARTARRRGDLADFSRHLQACERLQEVTAASALEKYLVRAQEGNLDGTEQPLLRLLQSHDPDSPLIWEALGKGYLTALHLAEAMDCFDKLLDQQPDNYLALVSRARVWEIWNQYDQALSDYEKVVALRPELDRARLGYADNLNRLGRAREAVGQYELLHRRLPDNPDVVLSLARCWQDLHELEKGQSLLDTLLTDKPDLVPALVERGRIALRLNQSAQAEKWLRRAVQLAPKDRDAYFVLELCLESQGKNEEAQQCLAKLKEVQKEATHKAALLRQVVRTPHDPAIRWELGLIFRRDGDETQATRWLRSALIEDPNYQPAKAALGNR